MERRLERASVSQAECTPEPLQPSYTRRENKIVLLSSDKIDATEKTTVGQADNEAWHQQREGRITASNFYRVFTKVESMKVSKENSAGSDWDNFVNRYIIYPWSLYNTIEQRVLSNSHCFICSLISDVKSRKHSSHC